MTPEEKAKDIFDSYWYCLMQSDIRNRHYWSKECALIAVEEVINILPPTYNDYWEQVKDEIKKL